MISVFLPCFCAVSKCKNSVRWSWATVISRATVTSRAAVVSGAAGVSGAAVVSGAAAADSDILQLALSVHFEAG